MSRTLISLGTASISFASTLGFSLKTLRSENTATIAAISSIATATLGLIARRYTLEQNEKLDRKDFIIITGAALTGAALGGATSVVITEIITTIVVVNLIGGLFLNLFSLIFLPFLHFRFPPVRFI